MSKVDFELGSKVIPSLLNNIIYANEIGLKVSEIEGDAVLFYHSGKPPTLAALIGQCKHFYTQFYEQLKALRLKYSNDWNGSLIPEILGLKIILHYGDHVATVPIDKRIKLIGEDVISAHRLLKNNMVIDEYILLSHELLDIYRKDLDEEADWSEIKQGAIVDEHLGRIPFNYIALSPLNQDSNSRV
mgnify:CR=1 FL=1